MVRCCIIWQTNSVIAIWQHVIYWCGWSWVLSSKNVFFSSDSYSDGITPTRPRPQTCHTTKNRSSRKLAFIPLKWVMSGSLSLPNIFDVDWKMVQILYRKLAATLSLWLFALNVAQSVSFGFPKMPKLTHFRPRTVTDLEMLDHSGAISISIPFSATRPINLWEDIWIQFVWSFCFSVVRHLLARNTWELSVLNIIAAQIGDIQKASWKLTCLLQTLIYSTEKL